MRERRIRLEVRQVHVTRKSVGFLHVFLIPNSLVSRLLAALSGDTNLRNDGARVRLPRARLQSGGAAPAARIVAGRLLLSSSPPLLFSVIGSTNRAYPSP